MHRTDPYSFACAGPILDAMLDLSPMYNAQRGKILDYPYDVGFRAGHKEEPLEARLDGGPLDGQVVAIADLAAMILVGGKYRRHIGATYTPSNGGRYGVYLWEPDSN